MLPLLRREGKVKFKKGRMGKKDKLNEQVEMNAKRQITVMLYKLAEFNEQMQNLME